MVSMPKYKDYDTRREFVQAYNQWYQDVQALNKKACVQIDAADSGLRRGNKLEHKVISRQSKENQKTIHDAAFTNPVLRYILKREEFYAKQQSLFEEAQERILHA
jgi:TRAP-type mannitol/chloroaromatic compound transport system substrate-binding protein